MMVAEGRAGSRWYSRLPPGTPAAAGGPLMTEPTTDQPVLSRWTRCDVPLVLHVIPTGMARGAQREARALADHLDMPGTRVHRLLTLFAGNEEVVSDFSLGHPGGTSPAVGFDPRLTVRLRSELARLAPTVLVAHGSEPLKYLVPATIGRRTPLAYYAIGTYSGSGGRAQLELWRRLVARADAIAAEGDEVREQCIDLLGVPAARVAVTPNGRDPDVFHPDPAVPDRAEPTLLFVGALTAGKRPDVFIELTAMLRASGVRCRSLLAGDGPMRDKIAGAATDAGVELLGSRSDIADLMRRSDLMVFPSRPAGEGMPGVLIEAGMSGLAVIATDVPGAGTIVVEGETGFVTAVDDLEALTAHAITLLEDPGLRQAMGRAARTHCTANFSMDAVGRRWMSLLQPLLDSAGRRAP